MKKVYIAKEYGTWYYRKTGRGLEVELYNYKKNCVGVFPSVTVLCEVIRNSPRFY